MGSYTSRAVTNEEFKKIIKNIRNGYVDHHGIPHKPNNQVADILVLEANLGCRIGDIIALRHDSFVCDNGTWKLDIVEEKTGKKRCFIIPQPIKELIDKMDYGKDGRIFNLSKQAIWKHMRIVTEYLGLTKVSTHSLRKKVANDLYDSTGHDIEAVCEFLQHSSTAITMAYIRRSDKQLENAISKVVNIA